MRDRIKAVRKANNLSQVKFAEAIGISPQNVINWENGRNKPADSAIMLICSTFKVNREWLISGEGEPQMAKDKYTEIADFVAGLSKKQPNDFQIRLMSVLARLPEEQWENLAHIAKDLEEKA